MDLDKNCSHRQQRRSPRAYATMCAIVDRCFPWRYGDEYVSAIPTNRASSPSRGRLHQIPVPGWHRTMHFLSAAEMRVAVWVIYQPAFIECLENRPCLPIPGFPVLDGHPQLYGKELNPSSGTGELARRLGIRHPMTSIARTKKSNSNLKQEADYFPIISDLLCLLKSENAVHGSVHSRRNTDDSVSSSCPLREISMPFGSRTRTSDSVRLPQEPVGTIGTNDRSEGSTGDVSCFCRCRVIHLRSRLALTPCSSAMRATDTPDFRQASTSSVLACLSYRRRPSRLLPTTSRCNNSESCSAIGVHLQIGGHILTTQTMRFKMSMMDRLQSCLEKVHGNLDEMNVCLPIRTARQRYFFPVQSTEDRYGSAVYFFKSMMSGKVLDHFPIEDVRATAYCHFAD